MSLVAPERTSARGADRCEWLPVLLLAGATRLALAVISFHATSLPPLTHRGYENIAIALSLHAGHGYSSPFFIPSGPTAILPPGYPLLIAGAIAIFGTGSIAAAALIAFQLILSVLTVAVAMSLARSHFGVRTANFAGFLCAICVPVFFRALFIWDTTLSELLLIAAIVLVPRIKWTRRQSAAVGIGSAFAALVNPALLPTLAAVFAWSAWGRRVIPWLTVLTFAMFLAPWPIRNYGALHAFIPLRSNFGYELWAGNHPGTNGEFSRLDTPIFNAAERHKYVSEGEVAYMREKNQAAHQFIRANPVQFLRFCALRVVRFWMGDSAASPSPATPALSVLGLIGLVLLWNRRHVFALFALPLGIFPLTYYVTHADARFLAVLSPVLAVLAAHACEAFLRLFRTDKVSTPASEVPRAVGS